MKNRRPCKYHATTSYYPSGECKRCVDERYQRQKANGRRKEICALYRDRQTQEGLRDYIWPST